MGRDGIRPLECLESGGHNLLDEPFLADRPWSPAELGDGLNVETDGRSRQEADLGDRRFRIGASEINRLR
jgi:hypothetical protein